MSKSDHTWQDARCDYEKEILETQKKRLSYYVYFPCCEIDRLIEIEKVDDGEEVIGQCPECGNWVRFKYDKERDRYIAMDWPGKLD